LTVILGGASWRSAERLWRVEVGHPAARARHLAIAELGRGTRLSGSICGRFFHVVDDDALYRTPGRDQF